MSRNQPGSPIAERNAQSRLWRKTLPLVLGALACLGGSRVFAQAGRAQYISPEYHGPVLAYDQWGRPICPPCPQIPRRQILPWRTTPSQNPMGNQQPLQTPAEDFSQSAPTDLQFNAPEPGLGSPDLAFNSPAMIGDFFGSGGGTVIFVPPSTQQSFTTVTPINGMLRLAGNPAIQANFVSAGGFPASFSQGAVQPVSFGGVTVANPGTFFSPVFAPPFVSAFNLLENPNLSSAVQNTFPNSVVTHNGTTANEDPANPGDIYFVTSNYSAETTFTTTFQPPPIVVAIPSPSANGFVVGRQKISENTSPIPRDRVFANYSYFDNTPLAIGGVNVHRVTPGFEKTFLNGNASFEMRFPFASSLSTDIVAGGQTSTDDMTFGNINMVWKYLLTSNRTFGWSAGLSLTVPTGDDLAVTLPNGFQLLRVHNESVHLLPFTGFLWEPDSRFFLQGFAQADFDANGNSVYVNDLQGSLVKGGTANDQTFLFLDLGMGYWIYDNPHGGGITGIAPLVELHYNRSLQDSDVIQSGAFVVGTGKDKVQILDSVLGATVRLGDRAFLTAAYAAPIGNGSDQQFDGEARVTFNWYYGGSANSRLGYGSILP